MPPIGAPLRKWTLCLLLLCSIAPCVSTQSTNESTSLETSSSAGPSASSPSSSSFSTPISSKASSATSSLSRSSGSSYTESECPFRTINYITHTLPQQCLRTSWSASNQSASGWQASEGEATPTPEVVVPWAKERAGALESIREAEQQSVQSSPGANGEETGSRDATSTSGSTSTSTQVELEPELETDSPLDNANFLSFEDWKKQNLARVGQSPENVGQGRAVSSEQRARRRPVNVNALDSLGEEAEIELDFSGFGSPSAEREFVSDVAPSETQDAEEAAAAADSEGKAAPSSWALSKDAGKTCKERFNYASFDCAATVLKTNPKAKSSSSILVENKDSYMLNECSAENKFIIVELCDDILVDTIVLANYEFFSSMFRHFRVSVSDRYPVKMDRWRVLGTFEARNSREIQPFLITEPQIWARYLRIEFLTHYGNEFYCPMSLFRVHGTTMMEQFRREEEQARGDDDFEEPIEAADGEPVQTATIPIEGGEPPEVQVPVEPQKDTPVTSEAPPMADVSSSGVQPIESPSTDSTPHSQSGSIEQPTEVHVKSTETTPAAPGQADSTTEQRSDQSTSTSSTASKSDQLKESATAGGSGKEASQDSSSTDVSSPPASSSGTEGNNTTSTMSVQEPDPSPSNNKVASVPSGTSTGRVNNSTNNGSQGQPQTRSSSQTQPNPASPSTQESFFKSIHKRLQYLEANSTLSLQYIEEQSRILRDAFIKVEKKQLQKTEKFLDHLNSTVMQELKSYRNMYDQLWQSTILELEGMKERQKSEMGEIGARLSMVADELVWQKRMAVVQSTLLLLCLGLVLFVRSGTLNSQSDVPIMQQLGNTYSSFFDSPAHSPENTRGLRRRRTFRNMWRSDTSALSDRSGHLSDGVNVVSDAETDGRPSPVQIAYSPPSPATPGARSELGKELLSSPEQPRTSTLKDQHSGLLTPTEGGSDLSDEAQRIQVLETQSGPATPRGSRDSRPSWEEVDRAVDLLKAEEKDQSRDIEEDGRGRSKRSPLRRTESYDGPADDSPEDEDGDGLFVA